MPGLGLFTWWLCTPCFTACPLVCQIYQINHCCQRHTDIGYFFVPQNNGKRIQNTELVRGKGHRHLILRQQVNQLVHIMRSAKHNAVIRGNGLKAFFNNLLGKKPVAEMSTSGWLASARNDVVSRLASANRRAAWSVWCGI